MPEYVNQHPLADTFSQAVQQPQAEFAVACAVSQFVGSGEDPEKLFAPTVAPLLNLPAVDVTAVLGWFQAQGFSGPQGQVTTAHSDLNFVLEYRQGIPISLAVLLLEAARRAGLSGFGVNFPGHFLLRLEDYLIDPLTFNVLTDEDLAQIRQRAEADEQRLLQPATVQMIGLRMLNNIKAQYIAQRDFARALEVVDLQLACSVDQAELVSSFHFERGEYWQQLGLNAAARDAYLLCAGLCPYPQLAHKAQELADQLEDKGETFH